MRSIPILVTLVVAPVAVGCAGDDGGAMQAAPDAAVNVPACTGAAYDPCTDTTGYTDCTGGMTCRLFMMDGFTICTPTCDASNPCPDDKDGNPVTCNQMGRCKATPNECTP